MPQAAGFGSLARFTSIARRLAWVVAGLALLPAGPARAQPARPCEAAAAVAEREAGLPPGLLAAIGQVESGRHDGPAGPVTIWPWSVNVAGRGAVFPSQAEAVAYVGASLAAGSRSIDVGCFQINLQWHPSAFGTLLAAFDPVENARYAARYLLALYAETPDWATAIAHYHSRTDSLGQAYRSLVLAAWGPAGPAPDPVVVRMSGSALQVHVFYGAIRMPGSLAEPRPR